MCTEPNGQSSTKKVLEEAAYAREDTDEIADQEQRQNLNTEPTTTQGDCSVYRGPYWPDASKTRPAKITETNRREIRTKQM